MRLVTLVLMVATAVLVAGGCGEDGDQTGSSPTPATAASPAPTRGPIAPSALCHPASQPTPSYNVQVTAKWEGDDKIVIEGTARLPGRGSVNYFVCQDGEVSASLLWARQPTFENGKIRAESEVVDSPAGPLFDPDAEFTVVLQILGDPVQVPYFTVSIPVEGKPE